MGGTDRLPLDQAEQLAWELLKILEPSCQRIEIAGSIRRRQATCGDVELLAIPRLKTTVKTVDMFGTEETTTTSVLDEQCAALLERGVLQKRAGWGALLKLGRYKDFAVDISSVGFDTWGVYMAIKTGPADFSKKLVTSRNQNGFCPSHLTFKRTEDEGSSWLLRHKDTRETIPTPEEIDVFKALGLPYVEPELRT